MNLKTALTVLAIVALSAASCSSSSEAVDVCGTLNEYVAASDDFGASTSFEDLTEPVAGLVANEVDIDAMSDAADRIVKAADDLDGAEVPGGLKRVVKGYGEYAEKLAARASEGGVDPSSVIGFALPVIQFADTPETREAGDFVTAECGEDVNWMGGVTAATFVVVTLNDLDPGPSEAPPTDTATDPTAALETISVLAEGLGSAAIYSGVTIEVRQVAVSNYNSSGALGASMQLELFLDNPTSSGLTLGFGSLLLNTPDGQRLSAADYDRLEVAAGATATGEVVFDIEEEPDDLGGWSLQVASSSDELPELIPLDQGPVANPYPITINPPTEHFTVLYPPIEQCTYQFDAVVESATIQLDVSMRDNQKARAGRGERILVVDLGLVNESDPAGACTADAPLAGVSYRADGGSGVVEALDTPDFQTEKLALGASGTAAGIPFVIKADVTSVTLLIGTDPVVPVELTFDPLPARPGD